jgi:hypothetical protein
MQVFRTRINHTTMVCERAYVDVEVPDLHTAITYVEQLYSAGELPNQDDLEWKEYYSETENCEVVPAGDYDGSPNGVQVVVPANWEPE